ncbi:MAG: hypothetical protein NC222_06075 [Staphylococcus sp.]|nr:hypothetical protein [Staphylococcus sp.]
MPEKNIQIKDLQGNLLYPKTKAAIVLNNDGDDLGTVEAGAQVNKIETISVNGTELQIVNKKANILIPAASEYTIVKDETAEEGFSATYSLTKDGTAVGAKINIPKDMVVQSGSVKTCTVADQPVEGFKVGDKYIDLVLANAESTHIYILATDLVDVYKAGTGLKLTDNTFSVDVEALKTDFATKDEYGDLVDTVTTLETTVEGKANKATTLAGYGITDAYTKTETYSKNDVYTKTEADNLLTDLLTYEELA